MPTVKNRITLFALTACLSLGATLPLSAGSTDGTATAVFLRLDRGARAMGMGGAFTAMERDVECAWYNPAGATLLSGYQINAGYSYLFEDISNSYAAIALPLGEEKTDTLIAQVSHMNMGSVEGRDGSGVLTQNVNPYGLVMGLGYARSIGPNLSLGVIAKNIVQNLGTDSGSTMALDGGLQLKVLPEATLGLSVQNLGSNLKTAGFENKLPMNLRLGAAYAVSPRLSVAVDGERPSDADMSFHLGGELALSESVTLRAGYNTRESAGLSAGIGLLTPISFDAFSMSRAGEDWEHNVVRIDYAYVNVGNLDSTHRLSLTLKL
ncbi:MAG: PorV/PorQ family protein [Endomicrobiales bacterium]